MAWSIQKESDRDPSLPKQEKLTGNKLSGFLVSQAAQTRSARPAADQAIHNIKIPLTKDSGILARTYLEGKTFLIDHISEDPRINKELAKRLNLDSFASIPIFAKDKVVGVIEVDNFMDKHPITEADLYLLTMLSHQAGLALENAELHKRTEELSTIDELTGAYNYRYFIQKFQEEKKRAVRYDLPLSVIMVDIDWFKKLNDSYGHEIGNMVLKSLTQTIKKCVRDVDIFARYGGEEFVVILPQTPQSEAYHIGERIRDQVEKTLIDAGTAGKLKVTVSVGVSSFPENGKSEEELVSVADQALYQAKGSGKNLVCVS